MYAAIAYPLSLPQTGSAWAKPTARQALWDSRDQWVANAPSVCLFFHLSLFTFHLSRASFFHRRLRTDMRQPAPPAIPGLTSVPETNEMASKNILQLSPISASNPYEYRRTVSKYI
jgi:hypothetical protein